MSLLTLLLIIFVAALLLSYLMVKVWKKSKQWLMTFLQNYIGILFIVSGFVKAIDPLGTAYKMDDYFAAFEVLFQNSWFSFLSPVFPFLTEYSILISVLMIVFEMLLGVMLILGAFPLFTAWGFLLLIILFLFLTGYTYLTGYVPPDINFWHFSQWTAFDAANMKVTTCGCFGDFITFAPFTSFMKDVVLFFPGIYFVIFNKKMHQLGKPFTRKLIAGISTALFVLYCMSNYYWNIPHFNLRPYKNGVNILEQQQKEADAASRTEPLRWHLKNKATGETIIVKNSEFDYAKYPTEQWEYVHTDFTEPEIPTTQISDFQVESFDGNIMTEDLLTYKGLTLVLVMEKLESKPIPTYVTVSDTVFRMDTSWIAETDSFTVVQNIQEIKNYNVTKYNHEWKSSYLKRFEQKIKPFVDDAKKANIKVVALVGGDADQVESFKEKTGLDIEYYTGDNIVLKTIIRSNPGILLLSNGTIIEQWHWRRLPDFDSYSRNLKVD